MDTSELMFSATRPYSEIKEVRHPNSVRTAHQGSGERYKARKWIAYLDKIQEGAAFERVIFWFWEGIRDGSDVVRIGPFHV